MMEYLNGDFDIYINNYCNLSCKNCSVLDYNGKVIIIVGSEGKGIRKLLLDSCDFISTIPMKGKINSLNVSAAVSAILFERNRQLLIK